MQKYLKITNNMIWYQSCQEYPHKSIHSAAKVWLCEQQWVASIYKKRKGE